MTTCRSCHNDMYEDFRHTGMGRSFDHATPDKSDARFGQHALVYDKKSNFYYRPFFKDSTLYITEFRLEDGDTIHQRTEKINYIVGSGQHTNSHILDINGYIYQAPITYYTQTQQWDMAPGFDRSNQRFGRLLAEECITCHNHYPTPIQGGVNKFANMPQGIECERCHGPGEIHVHKMLRGEHVDTAYAIDYSIVNPRHLERDLQMDLCQRCHLQGVAVLEEGHTFFDFKPGMRLSEVMNVFLPRYTNSHEDFIMASQADRLRQSPCYLNSPEMSCITCHNPHKGVSVTDNTTYNRQCKNCHQQQQCTEPMPLRQAKQDDCVTCHMPRSGSMDIPHVNITDHYISKATARKTKTITEDKKEAIAQFLGLEMLTKKEATALDMARGYIALYEKFAGYEQMLDSAYFYIQKIQDKNTTVFFKTNIHYLFVKKEYASIVRLAKDVDAASLSDAWTSYRIGEALYQYQQYPKALLFLKKAVRELPLHLEFQEKLGATYIQMRYLQEAKKVLEFVLSENEKRPIALTNLGYVYALQGKLDESVEWYDKAIALDPDYVQALLNKAAIMVLQKKKAAAQQLFNRILEIDSTNEQAITELKKL